MHGDAGGGGGYLAAVQMAGAKKEGGGGGGYLAAVQMAGIGA